MKNIVILGAGFGGLRAAIVLGKWAKKSRKRDYQVTLIDRNSYHTYTPLLYEISTTSKETANYLDLKSVTTYPIEKSLKRLSVEFIESEIKNINVTKNTIELASPRPQEATEWQEITYDYLVLALGSETNFFNIPGLQEKALELKSFYDAIKIRDAVWEMVESTAQNETVDIVIGGAGSTGVELAGEIQEWLSQLKKEGYGCRTSVTLIDAAPDILSSFDPKIIKIASQRLKKLGTSILTGEKIEKVEDNKAYLVSGKIVSFDLLIWTGGVKANPIAEKLPVKYEKQGRIGVPGELLCVFKKSSLEVRSNVYGIGDIVCVHDSGGRPVPMVARAAIIQGAVAAKNIINDTRGRKPHIKYNPKEYPYIIPVGGKYAIAKIGPIIITGFLGWILKGLVELNYLLSIMPNLRALRIWLRGLKIFIQNDRLG